MARCTYLYPDGARCLYDDHRLADGAVCAEHIRVNKYARHLADNVAREKRRRAEARAARLAEAQEEVRREQEQKAG